MRALILAAGEGSRLRPLTENKPKALVELCNKSLLERQVATLKIAGISDIAIATGYRGEQIQKLGFDCYHNPDYASTNMVNSLFNALPFLNSIKYFFPLRPIINSNFSERALTTETPTPCNPPETLYES